MFHRLWKIVLTLPALCIAASMLANSAVAAEKWPSHAVHIVVPFAPGGSNDVIARKLAESLTKSLGQTIVVENRAGAGSVVGADLVSRSAPDGYTFLFVSGSLATSAAVQKTPYDPLKAFDAVSMVARAPFVVLTRKGFPAKNMKELIAYAKANPGKINYGTAGLGDSTQLATEYLSAVAGIKMQPVGYKGISPAQLDLVAGRLDMIITTMASIKGSAADKLPKLAFTSAERDPDYPNIPTVRESGLDYVVDVWWGVFAPHGLPIDIRDRMNQKIAEAVAQPEFASFLKRINTQAASSTPQALQKLLARDVDRWTKTAERAGIRQK